MNFKSKFDTYEEYEKEIEHYEHLNSAPRSGMIQGVQRAREKKIETDNPEFTLRRAAKKEIIIKQRNEQFRFNSRRYLYIDLGLPLSYTEKQDSAIETIWRFLNSKGYRMYFNTPTFFTVWHSIYPWFCVEYHQDKWVCYKEFPLKVASLQRHKNDFFALIQTLQNAMKYSTIKVTSDNIYIEMKGETTDEEAQDFIKKWLYDLVFVLSHYQKQGLKYVRYNRNTAIPDSQLKFRHLSYY